MCRVWCGRKYVPCIYVLNKIDTITIEELNLLDRVPHYVPICAGREWGFDDLLEKVWQYLDMLRMCVRARCRTAALSDRAQLHKAQGTDSGL